MFQISAFGFGAFATEPLVVNDIEQTNSAGGFAIRRWRDEEYFEVVQRQNEAWISTYIFKPVGRHLTEFREACQFHQTSLQSRFMRGRVCSIMTETGRKTLTENKFVITEHDQKLEQSVDSEMHFATILEREFSIKSEESIERRLAHTHPKVLIIVGSARENSNTLEAIKKLSPFSHYDLVDLRTSRIRPYAYNSGATADDDFLAIAIKMLHADVIVFATPVYWYAMSTSMKLFFDRLTDLLGPYKSVGKRLKGKRVYVIASGGQPTPPDGFEIPFRLTSEYFDMQFVETLYQQAEQTV